MPSVHRRYSCSDGRLWPSPAEVRSGSEQYALVIVDESHHVYADSATQQEIEQRFVSSAARVLLLSDGSQSTAVHVDDDSESESTDASAADTMKVVLTEVVRCSRRVVEAAKPFQTATAETETTCHHHSAGVPLRSHLFPAATAAQTPADRTAVYARETAAAMVATAREFPGMSWDQVRSVVCTHSNKLCMMPHHSLTSYSLCLLLYSAFHNLALVLLPRSSPPLFPFCVSRSTFARSPL